MENLSISKFGGKQLCLLKFYLQILVYLQVRSFVEKNSYLEWLKISTILQIVKEIECFDKYVEIKACMKNISLLVWNKNTNINFRQKEKHSALRLRGKYTKNIAELLQNWTLLCYTAMHNNAN